MVSVCLVLGGYNLLFQRGCGPNPDEDPQVTAEGPGGGTAPGGRIHAATPSRKHHLGKACLVPREKRFLSLENPEELGWAWPQVAGDVGQVSWCFQVGPTTLTAPQE